MVLKLSRSMNSSASARAVALGAIDGRVEMREQLPAVRQIGERIVMREVIQLARALVDLRFQLDLIGAHGALRVLQLFGHLVERDGQRVELTHAASRHARAHRAARQTTRRFDQATHRRGHAGDGGDRDHDQQQHDARRSPKPAAGRPCRKRAPPSRSASASARRAGSTSCVTISAEISAPLSRNSIDCSLKSSMDLNAARRPAMTVAEVCATLRQPRLAVQLAPARRSAAAGRA